MNLSEQKTWIEPHHKFSFHFWALISHLEIFILDVLCLFLVIYRDVIVPISTYHLFKHL